MKFLVVFSGLLAVAFARPGVYLGAHSLVTPLSYAKLVPGAPIGLDGRVVDTPEVAVAKAEHAAAHLNEKITLANEAVKSADHVAVVAGGPIVAPVSHLATPLAHAAHVVPHHVVYAAGAPIGLDGRVVDTPEVAVAKAEHAAAHLNERIEHAHEAVKSASYEVPVLHAYSAPVVHQYLV